MPTVREIVSKYLGEFKEVSAGNLQVKKCPFCGREKGKFYIREDNGLYICHSGSCGAKGNLHDLIKHLEETKNIKIGDVKTGKVKAKKGNIRKLSPKDFHTLLNSLGQENNLPANDYLKSRGISPRSAWELNTLARKDNNDLAFFYQDLDGEVKGVKYRSIHEKKMYQEAGSQAVLWNINKATDKRVVICEGEFDCMVLVECGLLNQAVSVPMGVGNLDWIDNYKEWLEAKEEIILAFDYDDAGEKALRKVAQRLQHLNLKKIDLGDFKDINDFYLFNGKDAVIEMLNNVKEVEIQGIETLYDAGRFDINDIERFKAGINDLDMTLRGFKEGELIILAGDNGSGKTTISKQFMLSARQANKKVFVVNGEIQNNVFKEDLFLQANGNEKLEKIKDTMFDDVYDYKVSDDNYKKIDAWLKNYAYMMSSNEDLTAENVLSKIETAIIKNNCFFIVVDNLSVIQCTGENEAEAKGEFTVKLKKLATKYGVCIMLVNHFTKGAKDRGQEAIKGSGIITDVADIVMIIERTKDENADGKLRITKNRLKGKLMDIDLMYNGKNKCLLDRNTEVPTYSWKDYAEFEELEEQEFPF